MRIPHAVFCHGWSLALSSLSVKPFSSISTALTLVQLSRMPPLVVWWIRHFRFNLWYWMKAFSAAAASSDVRVYSNPPSKPCASGASPYIFHCSIDAYSRTTLPKWHQCPLKDLVVTANPSFIPAGITALHKIPPTGSSSFGHFRSTLHGRLHL